MVMWTDIHKQSYGGIDPSRIVNKIPINNTSIQSYGGIDPSRIVNKIPINNTSIPSQPVSQPIRQPLINIPNNKYYYDFNIGSPRLKPTPTQLDGVADIQIGNVNKTPMREINQSATNTNLLNNRTVKEVLNNTPWYKRINMPTVSLPRVTRGGAIGGVTGAITGGAIGGYFANQGNSDMGTTALVGAGTGLVGGAIGSATGYALGNVAKVAIPLAVIGGIGYGGYHVATADDRARAKLEQEQLDNFNSILQAQKDREMVNEYIKQQKLKEQYETEKQLALLKQLGNVVNNISPLPYDVNSYLYTEQLMTPSY